MSNPTKNFSLALLIFPFLSSVLTYAHVISQGGSGWLTGEWLINYSAGPIRRGLIGSLILLTPFEGSQLLWFTFLVQLFLYSLLLLFFIRFLYHLDFSNISVLLICSPAALLFVGLDANAFARKEVIGFVALFFLVSAQNRNAKSQMSLMVLSWLLYTLGVFSSEVVQVMFVSFCYILFLSQRIIRRTKFIWALLFSLSTILSLLFSLVFRGNKNQIDIICDQMYQRNLSSEICGGGIAALSWNYQRIQLEFDSLFPQYLLYFLVLILSLIPLWFVRSCFQHKFLLGCIFISKVPLFILGLDYGRWIHILIMELTIIALRNRVLPRQSLRFSVIVAYLTSWSFNHFGNPLLLGGVFRWIKRLFVTFIDFFF